MGIFGTSSPFDQDVERATGENNTSEDWALILEICDRAAAAGASGARECLRAVARRLAHADPHVALQAATLLDACVSNCGRAFLLEVASRDFEGELRRLLARAQPAVAQRLRRLLRKWAETDFRGDAQLDLIPSLYAKLRAEGVEFEPAAPPSGRAPPAPAPAAAAAAAQREQDELARAIALSLRDAPSAAAAAAPAAPAAEPLYPRVDAESPAPAPAPAPAAPAAREVRALYDFEAAEDNELTFMAGEIVHVTDSSDPNWWKGYNERGEGLFPANFVTADLGEPQKSEARETRSVRFAADSGGEAAAEGAEGAEGAGGAGGTGGAEPAVVDIDEATVDEALALLHEADPAAGAGGAGAGAGAGGACAADAALARLEARALAMGPLIDAALQRADRRHARLTQLSAELVDALNLYHSLMRDPLAPKAAPAPFAPLAPYFPAPHFAPPPPPPPPHSLPHLPPHLLAHPPQPQPQPQPQQPPPRC